MKNRINSLLVCVLVAGTFIMSSCEKEGPQGTAGPKGDPGATGATGAAGANGSANITSDNYIVYSSSWFYNGNYYAASLNNPHLTNAANDLVMTYVQGSSGDWFAVPLSNFWYGGDNMAFSYHSGQVTLYYTAPSAPASWNFKVMVIPHRMQHDNPGINWSDYKEVTTKFNLKD